MAEATRTIKTRFEGDASGLSRAARRAERDIDKFGRQSGKSFTSGFRNWMFGEGGQSLFKSGQTGGTVFGSGFAGMLATPVLGPIILAALLTVIGAVLPAIGAALASGLILAFGAGLVGLGVVFAAKFKVVEDAWSGVLGRMGDAMRGISGVFAPVLVNIAAMFEDTFNEFYPFLKDAFDKLAPVVERFADHFFEALERMAPAIEPVVDAFAALLDELGPKLPRLFEDIADSIANMANVIADNPERFADLITFLVDAADKAAEFIGVLANAFDSFLDFFDRVRIAILQLQIAVTTAIVWIVEEFAGLVAGLAPVVGFFDKDVGEAIAEAARDMTDFVTETEGKIADMKTEVKLRGEKRDLDEKIEAAKAKLRTVPESKKSALLADIRDLESKARRAQLMIDAVHGKTVTIKVRADIPQGFTARSLEHYIGAGGTQWFAHTGDSESRTQPPLTFNATIPVYLDGALVDQRVHSIVAERESRQAYRATVGRR